MLETKMVPWCPICKSRQFKSFNNRENAVCVSCYSLERTRCVWLVLKELGVLFSQNKVLHFAPEPALAMKLNQIHGNNYVPVDLEPNKFKNVSNLIGRDIKKFDLCQDLSKIEDNKFDLVLHNHVLEHIPCDVDYVLKEVFRILKPLGFHVFTVPMKGSKTDEDLGEISDEDRCKRFGQIDHLRIFGSDFIEHVALLHLDSGSVVFPINQNFTQETMSMHHVPSHSQLVFVIRKNVSFELW